MILVNRMGPFSVSRSNLPGLLVWIFGWAAMWLLSAQLGLSNLGLILVLTSAIAAIWLSVRVTLFASLIALMAFNWTFVPPQRTFAIDFHQDALLLLAMLVVNIIIASLMASLREKSRQSQVHADAVDALRSWSDRLRDADDPRDLLPALQALLGELSGRECALLALQSGLPSGEQASASAEYGAIDKEQRDALWHCLRSGQSLGPATGRYEELNDLYLPLRGRGIPYGAALISAVLARPFSQTVQAQALCDQMGIALERHHLLGQEQEARDQAQAQSVRNTLLAAISHDYRTPLATIMGAASLLEQQDERMSQAQRRQLAKSIVDEADRLRRLTNNILQLARLDAVGTQISTDWESAEEIIGSVVHRMRAHIDYSRLKTNVQPGLPLIRGDSLLLSQLLENLIDNAFKYGEPHSPVEVSASADENLMTIAVSNKIEGMEAAQFEQFFLPFQRGSQAQATGVGIGLALCRAIARAHGGDLQVRNGDSSLRFECLLPLGSQPRMNSEEMS